MRALFPLPTCFCIAFLLVFACEAALCAEEVGHSSLGLATHLYTEAVDAPANKTRVAGTLIELFYKRQLTQQVAVSIDGGLRLEGGSSRALYDDEFAPRQTPLLREASLTYSPWEFCRFGVGSINQNALGSPLIAQDQSFPGAREACEPAYKHYSFGVEAEQTYANDTQFTHPTGRSLQSDALFFIERLKFQYRPTDDFSAEVHLSHYLFSGLSALVAYDSQFLGNTASGLNDNNADFAYEYTPYEAGLDLKKSFKDLELGLRGEIIENTGAPSGKNKAWLVALQPTYNYSPNYKWAGTFKYYDLDSDATPAFFNDPSTAHANSAGFGVEVKLFLVQQKTEALVSYTLSHPLSTTLYQPGQQSWAFAALRLNYDIL